MARTEKGTLDKNGKLRQSRKMLITAKVKIYMRIRKSSGAAQTVEAQFSRLTSLTLQFAIALTRRSSRDEPAK